MTDLAPLFEQHAAEDARRLGAIEGKLDDITEKFDRKVSFKLLVVVITLSAAAIGSLHLRMFEMSNNLSYIMGRFIDADLEYADENKATTFEDYSSR